MRCGHQIHITGKNILYQINSACHDIPQEFRNINVWITGHSLGAATATLAYARLLFCPHDLTDKRVKLRGAYTFGSPRVGNAVFRALVDGKGATEKVKNYRVVNANDAVTTIPFPDPSDETYVHLGEPRFLSLRGKPKKERKCGDRFLNLVYTITDQLKNLGPAMWTSGIYNRMVRTLVPFVVYDHFPIEYIRHLI